MDVSLLAQLDREFRVVAFDWEGTAVSKGDGDASAIRRPVERLLRAGVHIVVIASAHISDIDRQLSRPIRGPHKRRLRLATPCGSAVYGFDARSELELLWQHQDGGTGREGALRWISRELAMPLGIPGEHILLGGDVLARTLRPASAEAEAFGACGDAVVVAVGPGPSGLPPEVVCLGGGPARFRELLSALAARHPVVMPAVSIGDPIWELVEDGTTLTREHEFESLFALGNGHVGSRASLAEGSVLSSPATFIAGFFHPSAGASSAPALQPMPDWTRIGGRAKGAPVHVDIGTSLDHRRVLDLRQAVLFRHWRHRDAEGRVTRIGGVRLISLANRRLLLQSVDFTPENYSGDLVIEAALSGTSWWSRTEGKSVSVAVASMLEQPAGFERLSEPSGGDTTRWDLTVEIGKTYRLDRVFCVHTSRDGARPELSAHQEIEEILRSASVEDLVRAHRARWSELWQACDVRVEGDDAAQRALRFAIYHLLAAVDPDDERVSIGARALTGSAYQGHVFWDTEIFMLPFFTLTRAPAARALLMYRWHTLAAARARANAMGYDGALYAWESAATGDDVTPPFVLSPDGEIVPILVGTQEQHISADVAYAVFSYWQWTADHEFLHRAGAEILIETARFWASRCELGDDGRFHIPRVIGPDEYHESVDDNAYTNCMAQWNLERGAEVARLLETRWPDRFRELQERLALDPGEPQRWLRTAAAMYTGFDPATGLFEQFRGYFELEEIELTREERRAAPLELTLGRERIRKSRVVKQADVMMLIYLLWDRFPPHVRERNFRFYEPRTAHGSSLSPSIHALLAARLGDMALARSYLRQAAEIDLSDNMGNASGGVHAASLGGLWQAVVFGFAGLRWTPSGPRLCANLPPDWRSLEFSVQWRGQPFRVSLPSGAGARVSSEPREVPT